MIDYNHWVIGILLGALFFLCLEWLRENWVKKQNYRAWHQEDFDKW